MESKGENGKPYAKVRMSKRQGNKVNGQKRAKNTEKASRQVATGAIIVRAPRETPLLLSISVVVVPFGEDPVDPTRPLPFPLPFDPELVPEPELLPPLTPPSGTTTLPTLLHAA